MKKHHKNNQDTQASQIIELKKQIEELKDGWQRTQADFDNFQKRTQEEREQMLNFLKADFMLKITPVLDNFRRAFEHTDNKKDDPVISGLKQIEKQLEDILEAEGLQKIEAKTGTHFDPNLHEAISCEPNDLAENLIIAEVESGWKFGDRVLKPAKVRVSKEK